MVNVLSKQSVLEKIKKDLFISLDYADEIIIAEFIRSQIWALSVNRLDNNVIKVEPINKRSVLYSARQSFSCLTGYDSLSNPDNEDFFSKVINELTRVGDIIKLPKGKLAPAQLRLIKLNQHNKFLLVGGVPTGLLPLKLRKSVTWSGFSRMVEVSGDYTLKEYGIPIDTILNWLGIPEVSSNISDWFDTYIKGMKFSVDGISEVLSSVEILVSSGFNRVGWVPAQELKEDISGIYLCKTEGRPFRYYLVQTKNGKLLSCAEQPRLILRRLRAFFLHRFGRPLSSKVTEKGNTVSFETLTTNIPAKENKVLSSFGFEHRDLENKLSCWVFQKEGWVEVEPFLKWLGF